MKTNSQPAANETTSSSLTRRITLRGRLVGALLLALALGACSQPAAQAGRPGAGTSPTRSMDAVVSVALSPAAPGGTHVTVANPSATAGDVLAADFKNDAPFYAAFLVLALGAVAVFAKDSLAHAGQPVATDY